MNIKINGKEETIQGTGSLTDLINEKGLKQSGIVIEHNLKVVSKEQWAQVMLQNGDRVEIVSFVGGG